MLWVEWERASAAGDLNPPLPDLGALMAETAARNREAVAGEPDQIARDDDERGTGS